MSDICIHTEHLFKCFGDTIAVNDVSLTIPSQKIYGFLGPNGSGKSTTIRLLTGLLKPTSGHINVLGYTLPKDIEKVRLQLGYMTQKFSLYNDLTVIENLRFAAKIFGYSRQEQKRRIEASLSDYGLTHKQQALASTLSGGQKQRLALAVATLNNPPLLFLDEPTSAVDPENRRDFWEKIFDLCDQGTSVLVSTHYMDEAERCHQIALLDKGVVKAADTPQALMQGMNVIEIGGEGLRTLKQQLLALDGVLSAAQQGVNLRVLLESSIADPVAWLGQQSDTLHGRKMQKVRPSLEDVFVLYTHQTEDVPT